MSEQNEALLDLEQLEDLFDFDDDELNEFHQKLSENLNEEFKLMDDYIKQSDFTAIKKSGHTIKGACANFGFKMCAKYAHDIEFTADSQNMDKIIESFKKLQDCLEPSAKAFFEEKSKH